MVIMGEHYYELSDSFNSAAKTAIVNSSDTVTIKEAVENCK